MDPKKISLSFFTIGLPLAYYFGRDIIYDITAEYLGDNRRIRRRQIELKKEKENILKEVMTQKNLSKERSTDDQSSN